MTRRVEPRVIDFSRCEDRGRAVDRYRDELDAINANRPQRRIQGADSWVSRSGIRYTLDGDGKLHVTVPEPHPRVIRRAKRVLAQCKRNPEFPHRPYLFFRHERVRDIPPPILKRIYNESEGVGA